MLKENKNNDFVHFYLFAHKKHSSSLKNILICVSKINEGVTGLKKHEGE